MQKVSRLDAARQGERKYYTGKPCINGHLSQRYTTCGSCIQCTYLNTAKKTQLIRDMIKKADAAKEVLNGTTD